MKNERILLPVDKSGAEVNFPSHKGKEGTCDFMTPACAIACKQLPNVFKSHALKYFQEHDSDEIAEKILQDMDKMERDYLLWFHFSGDCPEIMTYKIANVIKYLSFLNVPQNGFTRNKEFWRLVKDVRTVKYVLTEEDENKAKELSKEGIVAIPEYNTERIRILTNGREYMCGGGSVTCGQGFVKEGEYLGVEDCQECRENNQGCWNTRKGLGRYKNRPKLFRQTQTVKEGMGGF